MQVHSLLLSHWGSPKFLYTLVYLFWWGSFVLFCCHITWHMGSLVPPPEMEPVPPAVEAGPLDHQGSPWVYFWTFSSWVQSLGWEDPLEKGIATHSSIPSWRISWKQRSPMDYSPWDHKESGTTEQLMLSLSYSQINKCWFREGM